LLSPGLVNFENERAKLQKTDKVFLGKFIIIIKITIANETHQFTNNTDCKKILLIHLGTYLLVKVP